VAPRRFAALFHAARVPGTTLQSFPFPRSRTRSRGPRASLRVSLSDRRRRRAYGSFTIAFPVEPSSLPVSPAGAVPGRMSRDESSLRSLDDHLDAPLERASEDRPFPSTLGSPVNGRHARFEALLPSGVRSLDDPMPWPGRDRRVGALLGFFLSRASSTTVQGAVIRADARSRDEPWTSHVAENPAASLRSRDPSSDARGHDPGIRRHAEVDRTRVPPSGSDPAHPRFANAVAPVASPTRRLRDTWSGLPAPPLGGAPCLPRPSRPAPRKGASRWTPETLRLNRRPVRPLARPAGGSPLSR